MRDPWKVLALLLALALGLVLLLREPREAPPAAPSGAGVEVPPAQEAAEAIESDPSPLREVAAAANTGQASLALLVRAVNPAGEPVRASIRIRQDGAAPQFCFAPDGAAGFLNLQPASLDLRVTAEGYLEAVATISLPPAPLEQEHVVVMEPSARIAIRFMTSDGRRLVDVVKERWPVHGASNAMPYVYATQGDESPILPLSLWDTFSSAHAQWEDGKDFFSTTEVDGWLSLNTRPPLLLHAMLRNQPLGSLALEGYPDALDFIVDLQQIEGLLGSIRLRLIGMDGQPRSDLFVNVNMGSRGPILRCTDGTGVYSMDGLPPGAFSVSAFTKERQTAHRAVLLLPGQHLDLGDVQLEALSELHGKILDPQDQGVAGAKAFLWDPASALIIYTSVQELKSDAEGGLTWWAASGTRELAILPPAGSSLAAGAWQVNPQADGQEFRLLPGFPIRFETSGEDYQMRRVWLLVNGRAPAGNWHAGRLPQTVFLAPGEHAWILTDAAGQMQKRGTITVREGDPLQIVEVPFE